MPSYNRRRTVYSSSKQGRSSNNRRPSNKHGKYIDPSRFVSIGKMVEAVPYESKHMFADFALHPVVKENIIKKGFTVPTPIQDQTITLALEGRDIIGIANTGTGKTAAFAIPLIHKLMTDRNSKAIIIAPTRELAEQIEQDCRWIAKGSGLFGALLIGGTSMGPQLQNLRQNPQIIIGTPGRIKDHIERRTLNLASFNVVVLDEVDRMLDMGFVDDVTTILSHVSADKQSLYFSATMETRVKNLIHSYTNDPVTVSLKTGETTDMVNQDVVHYTTPTDKIEKLHEILISDMVQKSLVFGDTQRMVERLSVELQSRGFKADSIHGGKSQSQRQRALRRFKDSDIKILVATDVAARGIDVADITHVINFSQPKTYEDYVHRIGRAGRAGRIGHALTFID